MRSIAIVLLFASPCAAADWAFLRGDQLAQAPELATFCPCGDCQCVDCKCADNAAELQRLRAYRDSMEAWVAKFNLRSPARYAKYAKPAVVQAQPIVTYEEPVCVDGQCYLPSQKQTYTGGAYSNWTNAPVFKRIRGGFGGNCANGQCR